MAKIKVLQVDQWTSTAENIKNFTIDDFAPQNIRETVNKLFGGDAKTAQTIGITGVMIREVDEETDKPPIANVWFKPGPGGKLQFFKANYDCSD